MNEESFPAPEEQKEKKMRKVIWTLAVIAVMMVGAVAFTQTTTTHDTQVKDSVHDLTWVDSDFQAFGADIEWKYVPDLVDDGEKTYFFAFDMDGKFCSLGYSTDVLRDPDPGRLAGMVGRCLHELWLNVPEGKPWLYKMEDGELFTKLYREAYLEKCGSVYEPLAWQDIVDSKCELPDPVEVARSYYNWDE